MVKYVRQISPAEKLEIFKKIKGYCLWEGLPIMPIMEGILDEKVQDVSASLDYNMIVNYIELYKDYSYGR